MLIESHDLIENARRAAVCIYLACSEPIADDISEKLKATADRLEILQEAIDAFCSNQTASNNIANNHVKTLFKLRSK